MKPIDSLKTILLNLLKQHSNYAAVCTEPASITLASARAAESLDETPLSMEVWLSPHVLRNALTAGLPAGDRKGPEIACALGAVMMDSDAGLKMLLNCTDEDLKQAYEMVDQNLITVRAKDESGSVFVRVVAKGEVNSTEVIISGSHSSIKEIKKNKTPIYTDNTHNDDTYSTSSLSQFELEDILKAVSKISKEEAVFIERGARSNLCLAQKALDSSGFFCNNHPRAPEQGSCFEVRELVMSGIWMRMVGVPRPVFTSGGSGNQGLMISIPILCMADQYDANELETLQALIVANSVNLYFKAFMGEVSDICGGISAGAGTAAGISWLLERDLTVIKHAINTVVASLYGMICDGAKASCSLKGATSSVEAINAAWMAANGFSIPEGEGVIRKDLPQTLRSLSSDNDRTCKFIGL